MTTNQIDDQVANERRLHALIATHRRLSDALALEGACELPRDQWLATKKQRDAVAAEIRVVRNLVNGGQG